MARDPVPPPATGGWNPIRPWPVMIGAVALAILGLCFSYFDASALVATRILLLGAGLIAAGAAVRLRLKNAGQALDERIESSCVVAVAAFVALFAYGGMENAWDSGHIFFGCLIAVGLLGSVLVLLPTVARRFVLSLLVVLHFGGIFVAVTAVEPAGQQSPWLAVQLWQRFYRPYLQSMYLINAYHFYSPNPGPATLLWFCVTYEDGSLRWMKIPNRDESPTPLHYQRMLSATESTNATIQRLPPTEEELKQSGPVSGMRALSQETIMSRRLRAGSSFYAEPIPTIAQPMASQYGEPMEYARMMLSSYARYVCRTLPHQHDPNCRAKSVKIYRITHQIITPAELAEGHDVLDVRNLWAFFQGEFDTTGKLISPDDPFLYWRVPIVYVPKEWPNPNTPFRDDLPMEQMRLLDGVKLHAEYRSSDQKKSQ